MTRERGIEGLGNGILTPRRWESKIVMKINKAGSSSKRHLGFKQKGCVGFCSDGCKGATSSRKKGTNGRKHEAASKCQRWSQCLWIDPRVSLPCTSQMAELRKGEALTGPPVSTFSFVTRDLSRCNRYLPPCNGCFPVQTYWLHTVHANISKCPACIGLPSLP